MEYDILCMRTVLFVLSWFLLAVITLITLSYDKQSNISTTTTTTTNA